MKLHLTPKHIGSYQTANMMKYFVRITHSITSHSCSLSSDLLSVNVFTLRLRWNQVTSNRLSHLRLGD